MQAPARALTSSRNCKMSQCRPMAQKSVSRRPVTILAAHASVAPPTLSTYPFKSASSQQQAGSTTSPAAWLPTAMPRIVQTVASTGRPLLQLIYTRPHLHFQTLAVPAAIADEPQRWSDMGQYVQDAQADGLVLVRPIPSPSAGICACGSSPSDACSGTPTAMPVDLEGKVGLCCAGDTKRAYPASSNGNGNGYSAAKNGNGNGNGMKHSNGNGNGNGNGKAHAAANQQDVVYYGVVVQSKSPALEHGDGCYLLKATRNAASTDGCSCTHYSLTHVCSGQPLYQQLKESWLA